MAKGFKHGAGGASLNFKVICNPQPASAKENTIWVDTDKINNYHFSATQPENMGEYDVWFPVGTSSAVAFSATKKNPTMVYPISAKQYIGGALVDKTAKSWQGGEWVGWTTYLYKDGHLKDGDKLITLQANGTQSVTHSEKSIDVTCTSSVALIYLSYPVPVNFTNVKKLTAKIRANASNTATGGEGWKAAVRVGISGTSGFPGADREYAAIAKQQNVVSGTVYNIELPNLTLSGEHYIHFLFTNNGNNVTNVSIMEVFYD